LLGYALSIGQSHFRREIISLSLVNTNDAAEASRDVIEKTFYHRQQDILRGQA
jgi:hypothetical protein